MSGSFGGSSGYGYSPRPRRPPGYYTNPYRTYGGYRYYHNPVRDTFTNIISTIAILLIFAIVAVAVMQGSKPKNTIVRTKLETGNAYDNNCIEDEIGWFDNIHNTAAGLKEFWEDTGVQPYILLKADDGTLTTDAEKQEWAEEYYDTYIDREDAFLYVYFYQNGEESTGIPSYMSYVNGYQTSSVMDSMAVEIFWNYIDRYWTTDLSTDDVFVNAFTDTGDTIMKVSTTGKDLIKWIIIAVIVIIIAIVLIRLSKVWFKDRRERAQEDERILNTRVERMGSDSTSDLEDRYLN